MAHLKKEQYEYRRESAARRSLDNEAVAVANGMSEEQAELIGELCSLRHELHTNMRSVAISDYDGLNIKKRLLDVNIRIAQSGLEPMSFIPTDENDYIDIDDLYLLPDMDAECGEPWPESGTREYQDKWDEEFGRIYGELEALNTDIEGYLADIDKKYKTKWCPTGALRNF